MNKLIPKNNTLFLGIEIFIILRGDLVDKYRLI